MAPRNHKYRQSAKSWGPSAVTATAVHLIKGVACKLLDVPQGRTLHKPHFIATPNRGRFAIKHPALPKDSSIVDFRRTLDSEVNKMIKSDIPITVYRNMTFQDAFDHFGEDIIDRFYDIDEVKFHLFLNNEFKRKFGYDMYKNRYEAEGPTFLRGRFKVIDGIEVDMKESLLAMLEETGGNPDDLMNNHTKHYVKKRRQWMRAHGLYDEKLRRERGISDMEWVIGQQLTHKLGIRTKLTPTDWGNYFDEDEIPNEFGVAPMDLRISCVQFGDEFNGLCLPNSRSPLFNSWNIRDQIGYLRSTAELGRIVITQVRYDRGSRQVYIYFDVFPGFDAKVMGPNPYVMFRENFGIKHLASVIPVDHELYIPRMAEPIDFRKDGFFFDIQSHPSHRFAGMPIEMFERQSMKQRRYTFPDGLAEKVKDNIPPAIDEDVTPEIKMRKIDTSLASSRR